MSFDFIFMLTDNDKTVSNARAHLWEALAGGAKHIGFKDIGLPFAALKLLVVDMKIAGARSYLEVVSLDAESELRSAHSAIELGVDCLLGGTRATKVAPLVRDHPMKYYPFPGTIVGHPSMLTGSCAEIAESARHLTSLDGVDGIDLLAYRYDGNVSELMQAVSKASSKPVIVAGSIDCERRIADVAASGAAGFTVGTAAFRNAFQAHAEGLSGQVEAIGRLADHYTSAPQRNNPHLIAN